MVNVANMEDWTLLLEDLHTLAQPTGLAVALSGGLDSRFIVHAALRAGCDVLALHARGVHIPESDTRNAESWARKRGLRLLVLDVEILNLEDVAENTRERCYQCKKHLMKLMMERAGRRVLCDGTNADDLGMYRPGLRALDEEGVRSPLVDAGIGKARIRELGRATGLEDPDQAARPCLLTRLPYGMRPDASLLRRIAVAESRLQALGLKEFRLRVTPEPILQTQPLTDQQRSEAVRLLEDSGFAQPRVMVDTTVGGFFDR